VSPETWTRDGSGIEKRMLSRDRSRLVYSQLCQRAPEVADSVARHQRLAHGESEANQAARVRTRIGQATLHNS
jgi:hypothetical protein